MISREMRRQKRYDWHLEWWPRPGSIHDGKQTWIILRGRTVADIVVFARGFYSKSDLRRVHATVIRRPQWRENQCPASVIRRGREWYCAREAGHAGDHVGMADDPLIRGIITWSDGG